MQTSKTIPADFPRDILPAALAGIQPNAARLVDGRFVAGLTEDERGERYDACEDLAQQLAAYCTRKASENPDWTRETAIERVRRGMVAKIRKG